MENSTKLIQTIKKMLTKGLTSSEKIKLSTEKSVSHLLQKQWEENSYTHIKDQIDPVEIWENIISNCWNENQRKNIKKQRYLRIVYSVAVACLLLTLGIWTSDYLANPVIIISSPTDTRTIVTLPDQSKVWLSSESTIHYKKKFLNNRTITLEGEAAFDVKKSVSPFQVRFQNATVEVKGTEFNIKSINNLAEIALFKGKIEFSTDQHRHIEMHPSEQIIYNTITQELTHSHIDLQEYDWRAEEYRFLDKPISELIKVINDSYNAKIRIHNIKDEHYLFSGTIRKNETLENILDKICISFNLKIRAEKDGIILY